MVDDCVWINSATTVIYPVQNITLNRKEKAMTENEKRQMTDAEIEVYQITQLQRVLDASGWTVIYMGLFNRYLCHYGRGIIDHITWDTPVQAKDDLLFMVEKIQLDPWGDRA
jgi:hypothetical protein